MKYLRPFFALLVLSVPSQAAITHLYDKLYVNGAAYAIDAVEEDVDFFGGEFDVDGNLRSYSGSATRPTASASAAASILASFTNLSSGIKANNRSETSGEATFTGTASASNGAKVELDVTRELIFSISVATPYQVSVSGDVTGGGSYRIGISRSLDGGTIYQPYDVFRSNSSKSEGVTSGMLPAGDYFFSHFVLNPAERGSPASVIAESEFVLGIPEPSSAALLMLSGLGLLVRRRAAYQTVRTVGCG